jgi:hypothetical protein
MDDLAKQIQDAVTGAVKGQVAEFLEQNLGAKEFLRDRAQRLGVLAADYVKAKDDEERKQVLMEMGLVKQSCLNELTTVTLIATKETRAAFTAALMATIDVLVKVLPSVLASL